MKNSRMWWSVAAVALIIGGFVVDRAVLDDSSDPGDTSVTDDNADDQPSNDDASDLPTVTLDRLPPEALDVLQLIENGGPYAYAQDDSVFQNREGILPPHQRGHYREYTVETPGSSDRGARRIVAGADGERYWTDDHYASFAEILF